MAAWLSRPSLEEKPGGRNLGRRAVSPLECSIARGLAAQFHLLRREDRIAREWAEVVMTLSTEQEFPYLLALGAIVRGWSLAVQGRVEEGEVQMRQGLDAFRAMRIERERSYYLGLLAEVYGKGRQVEEKITVLAEALAVVDRTGERVYEAELYQLKGELTLKKFEVRRSKFPTPNTSHPSGGGSRSLFSQGY